MLGAWLRIAAVVPAALTAQPVQADALEIRHEPVACVPLDRYARIVATASPPEDVESADLEFRVDPDGAWYSSRMSAERGEWSALLPRPAPSLRRFEYRIKMTPSRHGPLATPPVTVAVSDDPDACPTIAQASLGSSIVVRVPAGAPVVPPVPAGFNPTGVVAAQEREPPKSNRKWVVLGSLGLAGAAAGVVAATISNPLPPEQLVPSFAFDYAYPPPGSTLSLRNTSLWLAVDLIWPRDKPLTFTWRLELREAAGTPVCAVMTDVYDRATSQCPECANVGLTAPLAASGACGERFAVEVGRLTMTFQGQIVWDVTLDLPYRVEP